MGLFSSCKESSKIPAPAFTSVPLIFGKVSDDVSKSYFDFVRGRASIVELDTLPNRTRPLFEFTIDIPNQRDVQIKSVEVYKSFKRLTRIGPRTLVGAYESFPTKISLNSQQALAGLQQLTTPTGALPSLNALVGASPEVRNPIFSGDVVVFTFEYVLQDGSRVILTPLSEVRLANGTITRVISGNQINPPYAVYGIFQTR